MYIGLTRTPLISYNSHHKSRAQSRETLAGPRRFLCALFKFHLAAVDEYERVALHQRRHEGG